MRRSYIKLLSGATLELRMLRLQQLAHYFPQFNDLKIWRAATPVVYPADDDVSAAGVMTMGAEAAALVLKLDARILISPMISS